MKSHCHQVRFAILLSIACSIPVLASEEQTLGNCSSLLELRENHELQEHMGTLANSFVFSENFGPYFLYGGLPSQAQFWNALRGWNLTRIHKEMCTEDKIKRVLETFEMAMPLRRFLKSSEGKNLAGDIKSYVLPSMADETSEHFTKALVDFSKGKPEWLEPYLYSLCLGQSWMPYPLGREVCVRWMAWLGLDEARSREILERASSLYEAGLIDEVLKLRSQIRKLMKLFDLSELGWIALHMSLADRRIEEVILSYLRNGLPDWSKRQLFEALLEKGEGEALMRIAEIADDFFSRHPWELERIKCIAADKISLKEISYEQVVSFLQTAAKHYGIASMNALAR